VELSNLYSSPYINYSGIKSRRIGWVGHVARMGDRQGVYRVLVVRPEGKRSLGRHKRRWEDDIKTDIQEVRWGRKD